MATSVSASFSMGDVSPHRLLQRPTHHHQSILPLRRERTTVIDDFNRARDTNPVYSQELPVRSAAFSGEKQYDRRQTSSQARSAKSDEVFRLIDRRLLTGVHGVRHMFRSNDPNREGQLSREAFRRVLMQLCGFINADEWEKVCRLFHLNERGGMITFEEFLSYFPDNEKVKRELVASHVDRRQSSLLSLSQNVTCAQQSYRKRFLTKLTANYCFSLMKTRCRDPSFTPGDYLPYDCVNDGVIIREHLKKILENFQLADILSNETEFEKLWSKFDLDNVGYVRSQVFLRLLDYGVNLADEIDANIQRLVSRSNAVRLTDRRTSSSSLVAGINNSSSKRKRPVKLNGTTIESNEQDEDNASKQLAPPPSALDVPNDQELTRELSTKFRSLVQNHRKMVKQLHETDEFLPFLDRKVNEGYFCLKTVFQYLDPTPTQSISKQQLVVALNQFDIPVDLGNVDSFLKRHHLGGLKANRDDEPIDYNAFLKYFQDRSDSSFLARTLSTFSKEKSKGTPAASNTIEHGVIDLLHRLFLSLTAAFKFISSDLDDLCSEEELFLILKKELGLPDSYQFSGKQKNEVYNLLNCQEQLKKKRQLPYKRLLHFLSKTTIPMPKERSVEKKEEPQVEKPLTPPRKLAYIEKTLNDLIRLRMHTFTKVFSRVDQPRTDKINKEQFYEVLQQMDTDLTRSEINMIWSSSGFPMEKSIPFSNLIRQLIMFNRDENQLMLSHFVQRSQAIHDRAPSSAGRLSVSTRALSTSEEMNTTLPASQVADYHDIYNRILPYIRQSYTQIKAELMENDPTASGLIDFSVLLDILHQYSVPINDMEFSSLIRVDNPRNGSKVQYPFFLRKYHPDGPLVRTSPWARVHPIYEQLIQKHHAKHPMKEIYDQRTQNPRDLKYLIRLFHSYDKPRKGFLTNDQFYSLLTDNGVQLNKSSEDYYQLFSKFDRQLRDQFNYTDLFHTMIYSIMS